MSSEPGSARQTAAPPGASGAERLKEEVLRRYQDLVDQKYLRGLTEAEQNEMDRLGEEIDHIVGEFYEPILADLRERLKKRAAGS